MLYKISRTIIAAVLMLGIVLSCGCDKSDKEAELEIKNLPTGSKFLSGQIWIDGSSTVFPITDRAAKDFGKVQPNVWIKVDLSGSGRGISRLLDGDIDLANASRCIKAKEVQAAQERGIDFIELPVAFDGIAVVVNSQNNWVDYLSTDELKKLWANGSTIKYWSDIRSSWPKVEVKPCAPTKESGTFDFFTKKICGKNGNIREDYFAHEDEHVLGPYVQKNEGAIGFFGYGWYKTYSDGLRAVPIAHSGSEAIEPNAETITNGSYAPLARPLFIYINSEQVKKPEIKAFIDYYLENITELVQQANYFPLGDNNYQLVASRFKAQTSGSAFVSAVKGMSLSQILAPNSQKAAMDN